MKVHIWPQATDREQDGGIPRVVLAQQDLLPQHGITIVDTPEKADLIACHIAIPPAFLKQFPDKLFVAHNHGMYWAEYQWEDWTRRANEDAIEAIRVADAVTAPSAWVRDIIARHTLRDAVVIPHGVDLDEWAPLPLAERSRHRYVFWDKARVDAVCDPGIVNALAEMLPDVHFVTTFGKPAPNVTVTGRLDYSLAKETTKKAGVYLATARETFGISVIQALAAGVPVVGWEWAGQAEMGINEALPGLLVPPGETQTQKLAEAIRVALGVDPQRLSDAVRRLGEGFSWEKPIAQYAGLYKALWAKKRAEKKAPRTSVLVTSFNLGPYLRECLDSVAAQTDQSWECVVVDDGSTDNSQEIAADFAKVDPRFRVLHTPSNLYLAGARNYGIAAAKGRYILPLDADDRLAPDTVATLAAALDQDRSIHVAYGNVLFTEEDGKLSNYGRDPGHSGWPMPFKYHEQWQRNLLPYSSMFRREAWELTGGYRRRCRTAEDADFWCRLSSYGFRPKLVTQNDTLIYRNRAGSMSRSQGRVNWTGWFGWSGDRLWRSPAGAATDGQLPIPSLAPPLFSVLIPVGPGHEELVWDALDSLEAQTDPRWEAIVAWDSPQRAPRLPAWVRLVKAGGVGVATARNRAALMAKGSYILPLDADDYLQPTAIEVFAAAAAKHPGATLYSDFWEDPSIPGEFSRYAANDWEPARLITNGAIAAVTQAIPKAVFDEVGGYDASLPAWEDWGFQLEAAALGHCSLRIAIPLWTYRKHTGFRRRENMAQFAGGKAAIQSRYGRFWQGEELMACRKCGGSRAAIASEPKPPGGTEDMSLLTYTGSEKAAKTFKGPSGQSYRFKGGTTQYVFNKDVKFLTQFPGFVPVANVAPANAPDLVSFNPAAQS